MNFRHVFTEMMGQCEKGGYSKKSSVTRVPKKIKGNGIYGNLQQLHLVGIWNGE